LVASTTLLIGRMPQRSRRSASHGGDDAIRTPRITRAQ
jgi:hypothetical protein